MSNPSKPGIYPRGGSRASFDEPGNEIEPREMVIATDTGEIGTEAGWFNPAKVGGKVKNIYYVETPPEKQDIYNNTPQVINGLSINLIPETENSTFIIVASISATFTHVASLLCYVNSESLYGHGNNSNQQGAIMTMYEGTNDVNHISSATLQTKYDAVGKDEIVIDIRATSSWAGSLYHLYINDRNSNDMRGISSMVIYEIERA